MSKPWHQRQKEQGAKLVLTWFTPRRCWKKYVSGEVKYFKHPDTAEGYEAAVLELHAWLNERKHTRPLGAEYQHHLELLRQCLDWYGRFGTPEDEEETYALLTQKVGKLEEALAGEEPLPPIAELLWQNPVKHEELKILLLFLKDGIFTEDEEERPPPESASDKRFGRLGYSLPDVWQERIRQLNILSSHQRKQPQTVGHQVQRFLDFKEIQVRGGVLKPRTWGTLNERLAIFVDWIKPGTHVGTINGTTVKEFYKWLLQQMEWGHETRKNIFRTARQWIRWAWREEDVELENLPRNINSDEFVFLAHLDATGVAKKTRTDLLWTPDDFHQALAGVPEDMQLYLLLMLNCGFTSIDVGTLRKSELRLKEGRIVRQRTKTRRHQNQLSWSSPFGGIGVTSTEDLGSYYEAESEWEVVDGELRVTEY